MTSSNSSAYSTSGSGPSEEPLPLNRSLGKLGCRVCWRPLTMACKVKRFEARASSAVIAPRFILSLRTRQQCSVFHTSPRLKFCMRALVLWPAVPLPVRVC